ncbi:MAG: hypothetical protein PHC86_06890 [Eubacteriales bacterium]|nr:hypothetical protein [Eubacteriales bacterium]
MNKIDVKRGQLTRNMLFPIIAGFLIIAVGVMILPRLFNGSDEPFAKGSTVKQVVRSDRDTTVGDSAKTGWQLEIPAHAVEQDLSLTMNVLSESDSEQYQTNAFEWIGTPVEITAGDGDGVFLDRSVRVTLEIPESLRTTKENADDYLAAYFNGADWDYLFPDHTKISDGFITFETDHFSLFSAVKPTEAEKIKLYTKKMAVQTWEDEERETVFSAQVMETFNEAFEKMGISDETVKGKLLRSVAKEYDFGTILVSTERGDVADFGVKCGELAANALIQHLKMEDALMENITGKGAAVATGLVKGALQLKDGNYTDATKELASAFIGYFPVGRAYQSTVEIIDASIASWKDYELDEAYKNYIKDAGDGASSVSNDDWALMCSTQMRGYLIRLQDEAKNNYCAVNGISRSELDSDPILSSRIASQTETNLRKTFEKRLASGKAVQVKEAEYGKIIEGFKRDLLLERGTFGFDFDMDIESRLRTLFAARKNILDLFGGEMPVLNSGDSAEANLNEAIAKWISLGPKNRGDFFAWLEEKGYKSQKTLSDGDQFAWVFVESKTNDWQAKLDAQNKKTEGSWRLDIAAGSGSATFVHTYTGSGSGDVWMKPGISQSGQVTWTAPSKTIIHPDEEFSIDLIVSHLYNDHSNQSGGWTGLAQVFLIDETGEQKGGAGYLSDRDGETSFTSSSSNNYQTFSSTVYGTIGAGAPGDRMAIRVAASPGVVGVQTYYIYEWKATS